MRVQLNPQLITVGARENVPLNDLSSIHTNTANFRKHQQESDQIEESLRLKKVVNEAYMKATGPDGNIDNNILQHHLSQNSGGSHIPTAQKANSDLLKTNADTAEKVAQTDKQVQEVLYNGLKLVDNTIASLASRTDVDDRMVYGEMANLVNAGAFNVQAKHVGTTPDVYAKNLLSTMPVGNPQALKAWLVQQGARTADATERLKLSLPKYDEQNRGGTINQGSINQMTGTRTAGVGPENNQVLTPTADGVLSAQTSRRGQDMIDARGRQFNEITREANNSQLVETPQGYQMVNKGTAASRPVSGEDGQPLLGKDSVVAKDARMADRLSGMIPLAKQLLQAGATSSGAGALADKVMNFAGVATKSGDAASALDTLSAWMTSNVPRFEGPQSNQDTATYQIMAGVVGDRTKPVSTRLKAIEAVENLMRPYAGKRDLPFDGPPGTRPATVVAPRAPIPSAGAPRASGGATGAQPAPGGTARPPIDSFFR